MAMKVFTPQIAWHNRERVATVDFQPKPFPTPTKCGGTRLATGGDDKHVIIWELVTDETGKVEPDCICDLVMHQNGINSLRWSPDGQTLASGDSCKDIILWQYNESKAAPDLFGEDEDGGFVNRENWTMWKILRGHLNDILGLSWSPCSKFIISGSVDSTAFIFNTEKGEKVKMLDDHNGWVNGVSWDPKSKFAVTISSDRSLRVYKTKKFGKATHRVYKAKLPVPVQVDKEDAASGMTIEERNVRLFHDDTFQSFYRRIDFSPDGELLVVPSGVLEIESEASLKHCTYVFTRNDFTKPVLYLPGKEISVAVKFSPVKYELRPVLRSTPAENGPVTGEENENEKDEVKPWNEYETVFSLPYRMIFAVLTQNQVVIYDTQQPEPIAKVSKIHYISLNDISWSADGNTLIVASTDGYCSIISFQPGQLGTPYTAPVEVAESERSGAADASSILDDSTVKTENETDASTAKSAEESMETGDDSILEEEDEDEDDDLENDSGDLNVSKDGIPLNKEGVCSPAEIKIRSVKEGGKPNPKRLQLITISSPKSAKKKSDVIDESDLSLVLEDTNINDINAANSSQNTNCIYPEPTAVVEPVKKRVQLITLSSPSTSKTPTGSTPVASTSKPDTENKQPSAKKRVPFVTLK